MKNTGRLQVSLPSDRDSKEVRDAVLASGMEHGAAETCDRLAELVEAQVASARA